MNTFEVGVISAIPVGGIVGGILCKSYGLFAIIGGVIAGGITGAFAGWAYSFLILTIMSVFIGIGRGIRKLPEFDFDDVDNQKLMNTMNKNNEHGAVWGVILGCIVGFLTTWWLGLIVAFVNAILNALVVAYLCIRKNQPEKRDN